jgi:cold shock CspA family protein
MQPTVQRDAFKTRGRPNYHDAAGADDLPKHGRIRSSGGADPGGSGKLDKYFRRITSCRVIVEAPHRHHRRGDPFHIRIELGVPGKELVVTHEPTLKHEEQGGWHKRLEVEGPHQDVYVAIRDGFKAMRRQLQDYVRCLRRDVKTHHRAPHAKVSKLFPKEGYGFIETLNGREIYFHKNRVLGSAFEHLDIGDEVIFSQEEGDKGPQAITICRAGKHHWVGAPEE